MWIASTDFGIRRVETLVGHSSQSIWTNLEYIHRAKKLDPHESGGLYSSSQFKFTLSCCSPSHKTASLTTGSLKEGMTLDSGNSTTILDRTFWAGIWVSLHNLFYLPSVQQHPKFGILSLLFCLSPEDLWPDSWDFGLSNVNNDSFWPPKLPLLSLCTVTLHFGTTERVLNLISSSIVFLFWCGKCFGLLSLLTFLGGPALVPAVCSRHLFNHSLAPS